MTSVNAPLVLYHATFEPYLADIFRWGLGGLPGGVAPNYPDSQPGQVYLARCPEVARSYVETCDSVPDEWLEQIVVLEVTVPVQDTAALAPDPNVRVGPGELAQSLVYPGAIPALFLRPWPVLGWPALRQRCAADKTPFSGPAASSLEGSRSHPGALWGLRQTGRR